MRNLFTLGKWRRLVLMSVIVLLGCYIAYILFFGIPQRNRDREERERFRQRTPEPSQEVMDRINKKIEEDYRNTKQEEAEPVSGGPHDPKQDSSTSVNGNPKGR